MANGIGRAYLDANVFIFMVEGNPERARPARKLLETFRSRKGIFVTSELSLAEVLAPSRQGVGRSMEQRRDYLSLLARNPSVLLLSVTRDILFETANLRRFTQHKLPDAIHCATAVRSQCSFLVSNDREMQRLPQGITWLDVDDAATETLLNATYG